MLERKFNKIKEYNKEIYNQEYLDSIRVNDKKLVDKLLSKYFNVYILSVFKTNEDILASIEGYEIDTEFDYYNNDLNKNHFRENLLISLFLINISLYLFCYLNIFNIYMPQLKYIILCLGILFLGIKTGLNNLRQKYYKNYEFLKIIARYSMFDKIIKDDYFTPEELEAIKEIRNVIKDVESEVYKESADYKKEVQKFIENNENIVTRYISLNELSSNDRVKYVIGLSKNNLIETLTGQKFLTTEEELVISYLDETNKPNYFEIIKILDSEVDHSAIKVESKLIDGYRVNTTIYLDKESLENFLDSRSVYIKRNTVTNKLLERYIKKG